MSDPDPIAAHVAAEADAPSDAMRGSAAEAVGADPLARAVESVLDVDLAASPLESVPADADPAAGPLESVVAGRDPEDLAAVTAQLGRPVRGVHAVAHRCGCGRPDVVTTLPTLPDGTPFPTLYYLTCPRATGAVSTLESEGRMRTMAAALAGDAELAAGYRAAHEAYLAERARLGTVAVIDGISAGGMPDRVKCLHVLVAHSLAAGAGVNPLGDQALAELAGRGIAPDLAWGGSAGGCLTGSA